MQLKRLVALILPLAMVAANNRAEAGAMFTITDLGTSETLQEDSSGTIHSVTSGDGSRTYVFEKSPVIQINERVPDSAYGLNAPDYQTTLLMQNGTHKTGYTFARISGGPEVWIPANWYQMIDWANRPGDKPVVDMNSHGEIVGYSTNDIYGKGQFAAFSAPDGFEHVNAAHNFVSNNLNEYIASELGVNLTFASKVDDLGQILAYGKLNGKDHLFLLTPDGQPTLAPEPSSLAILVCGLIGLGLRARIRPGITNGHVGTRPTPSAT